MNNLQKLLRIQRNELLLSFQKAGIEGEGTPQEVSDRREKAIHKFFECYFPFPYQVTKGNVSDSYGLRSHSIDTLIINPSHPHTVNQDDQFSFIMAEGVDYAIELKPELNSKVEVERALKQIQSVKKLRRRTDGLLHGRRDLSDIQRELALQVPSVIFSEKTYSNKRNLIEKIVSYYKENQIPENEQFDIICCLNGTLIINSGSSLYFNLKHNGTQDPHNGILILEAREDVLYYFFRLLFAIPQSTPSMKENMLNHYIEKPPSDGWTTFHDLNSILRNEA